jgi:TolB protein
VELGDNENPSFSPDGNMLVFSSSRLGGNDLYIMNFLGGDIHRITRNGEDYYNPVWLPQRK